MDCNNNSTSSCGSPSSLVAQKHQQMSPKSPPGSFDFYGKRRQIIKAQALEREIALLQEEVKFVETLQPASRCCKELDDFIGVKPDPFIATTNRDIQQSSGFWKRLRGKFCMSARWICCFSSCSLHIETPNCCNCGCCCCSNLQWPSCSCLTKLTCSKCCRSTEPPQHKSPKGNRCSNCANNCCCYSCCV